MHAQDSAAIGTPRVHTWHFSTNRRGPTTKTTCLLPNTIVLPVRRLIPCRHSLSAAPLVVQIAERLYTSGYLSYPRTESSAYPPNFDITGTVAAQRSHPVWGQYASALLQQGIKHPQVCVSCGSGQGCDGVVGAAAAGHQAPAGVYQLSMTAPDVCCYNGDKGQGKHPVWGQSCCSRASSTRRCVLAVY